MQGGGQGGTSKWDLLVRSYEMTPQVSGQLGEVLNTTEIVLLLDDSGSMNANVIDANYGNNQMNNNYGNNVVQQTRWLELKRLAAEVIRIVTAVEKQSGLDIYFLNRGVVKNVTDMSGLQQYFSNPPSGGTPLMGCLNQIYNDKKFVLGSGRKLLIVVVTDGEPSDCSHIQLQELLSTLTSNADVHVSFAECTDQEEDMAYLDRWDGVIKNFDNTEDFREEQRKVKMCMGQNFKFDYNDYVVKILLATFIRWYFNLDQSGNPGAKMYLGNMGNQGGVQGGRVQGGGVQGGYGGNAGYSGGGAVRNTDNDCCSIL